MFKIEKGRIELLWREFSLRLYKLILKQVKNTHDAEDILQEAFLKIEENINSINNFNKIKAWMYQVVKNLIYDYFRKKNREKNLVHQYVTKINERSSQLEYEDNIIENSFCKDFIDYPSCMESVLEPFLQTLPAVYREVIENIDIKGYKQKDFARERNLSLSCVKSRIKRARERLKFLIKKCCDLSLLKEKYQR